MANRYWFSSVSATWDTTTTASWSAAAAVVFTGSCSGTALTTTGSPSLVVGMTVNPTSGLSLGTIVSGSLNSWVVSVGGTFASQTMRAATTGASVPTAADSVIFDTANNATATTVTMSGSLTCLNFTVTGSTWTFTGSPPILAISGSMVINNSIIWANVSLSQITFNSTTTGNTVKTGGATINGNITFNGVGGGWTLASALTLNDSLNITAGTFDTSATNYSVSTPGINSVGASTRQINLNASTVTLSGATPFTYTGSGLTLNAGTSTLSCTGTAGGNFVGGGLTFYNVSYTGTAVGASVSITGANTFNNLTFPTVINAPTIVTFNANQTINGTFTPGGGATAILRRSFFSSTIGTTVTLTLASAVTASNCDFRDITAATSAITATTGGGNCGGNTNITFPVAKTVYWNLAGAQGSGGTPAVANFPLAQDTAVFDNTGSVTGTITINSTWNIGTIDMSARTTAMTLASASANVVYGSWKNGTGTTLSGTGTSTFAGRGTQQISGNSPTFTQAILFNNIGGTVQLASAIKASGLVTLTIGTFDLQSYTMTVGSFNTNNSNTRTLAFGTGTLAITLTGGFNATTATNLTTTGSGTVSMLFVGTKSFVGGGGTYNCTLSQDALGTLTISGSNTFNTITNTVQPVIFKFTSGTTQTVTNFTVNGTAGNLVTINSSVSGSSASLSKSSGVVSVDYLSIKDSAATGGATWNPGTNSVNVSGNSGWLFPPPNNFFMLF